MKTKTEPDNYLGTFTLGAQNVRLYADDSPSFSAAFVCLAADKGSQKMYVGMAGRSWTDVVASVLHECVESHLHTRGSAYYQTQTPRVTTDSYLFVMPHSAMDQAIDWAAMFLESCRGALRKEWVRRNKPVKGKRK